MFKKIKTNIKIEILVPKNWSKIKEETQERYIEAKLTNKNIVKFIELLKK